MSIEDLVIPELEEAPKYSTRNRLWTEEEEEILRKYYRKIDTATLAGYLNRTVVAVDQKAKYMRLLHDQQATDENHPAISGKESHSGS